MLRKRGDSHIATGSEEAICAVLVELDIGSAVSAQKGCLRKEKLYKRSA